MTTQNRPDNHKGDKTQPHQRRMAPKLRHSQIKSSEQAQYPEKLQYTGKNFRADFLNAEEALESKNDMAGKAREIRVKQQNTDPAAAGRKEAAIARARAQAELSQQSSGRRNFEEEASASEKKRQQVLLITAIVLLVAVLITFAAGSLLNRSPAKPVIQTKPSSTTPVKEEAWTPAEYQEAKLALSEEIVFPGIYIADVDLSGLSAEEATMALAEETERLRQKIEITVWANSDSFTLSADDLGYNYDTFSALEKAWSIGRSDEHYVDELDDVLRYQVISALEKDPLHIDLDGFFDLAVIKHSLQQKLSAVLPVFTEAKATGFDPVTLRFQVEDGTVGLNADISAAITDINQLLQDKEFQGEIHLQLEEKQPELTAAMIHNNTGFVAQASTPIYGSWQVDRNYNLIVAAEKMTGDVVQPGETYSYMTALGPITTATGFKAGSAIVGGTYIDVIGGGLCQPSTTLFQAVAKADLEIVERHNHGMRSPYYQYGQDAMIYGGSFDFKFRNNTDYPLAVVAETQGNYLVYKIYGQPLPEGVTIELASVKTGDLAPIESTQHVLNTEIEAGESKQTLEPVVGSTWETYKVYYKNGVEFDRQYLTYSRYPSVARRIEHGPSLPPTESVPETSPTTETTTTTTPAPTTAETSPSEPTGTE